MRQVVQNGTSGAKRDWWQKEELLVQSGTGGSKRDWWCKEGLVEQSLISASDMVGHREVRGLSATDPHPRLGISIMHYAQGCWYAGNRHPHVCAWE